jgi:hypothetical protein
MLLDQMIADEAPCRRREHLAPPEPLLKSELGRMKRRRIGCHDALAQYPTVNRCRMC